jgi:2-oxoglutarate ferredoxin oxidoreductase subunit delta
MNRVTVNPQFCKSCLYCINFCPKKVLVMGNERNSKGYFSPVPAEIDKCIACSICAVVCPEGAITVEKDVENDG